MKNIDLDFEVLTNGLLQWGISIDDIKLDKFKTYTRLLLEYNEKMNLTAITEPKEIMVQHFLDSLSVLTLDVLQPWMSVLDVGTGAGLPGIPIKILIPEINMILLDASKKRIGFLKHVIEILQLDGIEAIHGRAEEFGHSSYREMFDLVVSRAVAPLRILCEYCIPLVRVGGFFLSYKGPGVEKELNEASNALNLMGGSFIEIRNLLVPFSIKTHNIVVIHKINKTPDKYPRLPGKPEKSPL
jgi:16S rRNA (guanine527-N7)-methyltransferase